MVAIVSAPWPRAATMERAAKSPSSGSDREYSLWNGWKDATGTRLRGANVWQRRVIPELDGDEFLGPGPFGPPATQGDFDALAEAGANWVQLSHPGIFGELPPYALDEEAAANLDALVSMAARAGLYVTIAFRTGPGRSEFSILREGAGDWFDESLLVESVWTDAGAQAAWAAMWRAAAKRYSGAANVIGYDLMCEPNACAVVGEWDPKAFYKAHSGDTYDWNSWHPAIARAIREVDADTPILIEPDGYGDPGWVRHLAPPKVPRVVVAVHPYGPHEYTHQSRDDASKGKRAYPGAFDADYDGVPDRVSMSWLDAMLEPLRAMTWPPLELPVCANEFGAMHWQPGAADYLRDLIGLFEYRGMNWAIWEWPLAWKPYSSEVDAFDFRKEPAIGAVVLKAWARNDARP
jgi:hypothetical protein